MDQSELPDGNQCFRRFSTWYGLSGASAGVVIVVYMAALLRLPADQLKVLWWAIGAAAIIVTPLSAVVQRRMMRDLTLCLDRVAAEQASSADLHAGFATAVDLPRRAAILGFANFVSGTLLLLLPMYLLFEDFPLSAGLLFVAASTTGGLVGGLLQFFAIKHVLAPVRQGLAARIPDPADRARLAPTLPLVTKLAVVLVTVALVPVIFSVFLAYSRASQSAISLALQMQEALLEHADTLAEEDPGADPQALVVALQKDVAHWGIRTHVLLVSRDGDVDEILADRERALVSAALDVGEVRGDLEELESNNVVSWTEIGDEDELAIAVVTPRRALWDGGDLVGIFAAVVAVSTALALAVAWLVGRDVGHAARSLEAQAALVAGGDLGIQQPLESEDELGQLGRSFSGMAGALRETVGRVLETAARVEETGNRSCKAAALVSAGGRQRAETTQSCLQAVVSVSGQAREIQQSTVALNLLAEESSSSVLQMTAAGDQMRDTASVLSEKVDELSVGIEQGVRSIGEVKDNTETLAYAAQETSSSMEEMATALRQVDTTAEETTSLSASVVEAAESGQTKVQETVRGMESIRTATDSAQQVINALGERVQQIDAVLEVIHDIANRTNLLALNASIIAAQAGELGRPFAVVASEISDLAVRVRSSSEEIGNLIRSLQTESENAVGAIETGRESVASGVVLAREAGASLEVITSAARQSGERSREIVIAVRAQSKASCHVVEMMERVSHGLTAIRKATEEQDRSHQAVADGTRQMQDVAQQLRTTTEEQARVCRQIGESAEGVRAASEAIYALIDSQMTACTTSASLLEKLATQASSDEENASQMEETIRALVVDAETLRADAKDFKL